MFANVLDNAGSGGANGRGHALVVLNARHLRVHAYPALVVLGLRLCVDDCCSVTLVQKLCGGQVGAKLVCNKLRLFCGNVYSDSSNLKRVAKHAKRRLELAACDVQVCPAVLSVSALHVFDEAHPRISPSLCPASDLFLEGSRGLPSERLSQELR